MKLIRLASAGLMFLAAGGSISASPVYMDNVPKPSDARRLIQHLAPGHLDHVVFGRSFRGTDRPRRSRGILRLRKRRYWMGRLLELIRSELAIGELDIQSK